MRRFLDYIRFKLHKLKYSNPVSGVLFTLTRAEYRTEGCRFSFPRDRVGVRFRSQFFHDMYEDNERALVAEFLRPDDRVLELGGGIGVLACVTNRVLQKGRGAHVVVEANPYLIPYLYANRARNAADFAIEHCAVGSGREVTFFQGPDISRGSAHEETQQAVNVVARSLGELVAKHGGFDVLISDIQGGEIHVFGSSETLPEELRLVIVEWHAAIVGGQAIERCRKALLKSGFQPVRQRGDVEAWLREAPGKAGSAS